MLDRTAALENKSREAVIAELKAWNLDDAVKKLRSNPAERRKIMAQRPGTSAGIMRASAVRHFSIPLLGLPVLLPFVSCLTRSWKHYPPSYPVVCMGPPPPPTHTHTRARRVSHRVPRTSGLALAVPALRRSGVVALTVAWALRLPPRALRPLATVVRVTRRRRRRRRPTLNALPRPRHGLQSAKRAP